MAVIRAHYRMIRYLNLAVYHARISVLWFDNGHTLCLYSLHRLHDIDRYATYDLIYLYCSLSVMFSLIHYFLTA